MVRNTRAAGATTRPTARGNSGMRMATSMMDIGAMTRPTGRVSMCMSTGQSMTVSGRMTCNTDTVWRHGQTAQALRAPTVMAKNMARENIFGLMEANILEIGTITESTVT